MAEARPSKVGATWASNTTGSISTGVRPACFRARARVAPAIPAPAMMTSTSWLWRGRLLGRLMARYAHEARRRSSPAEFWTRWSIFHLRVPRAVPYWRPIGRVGPVLTGVGWSMAENGKSRLVPILVGSAAAVAVAVGGTIWWIGKQHYERTDNAFIQADKVAIAPLIDGYVAEVLVNDNQPVQPGQVLVRIDPVSIKARLAQAEANAQALEAGVAQVDDKARLEQAMIAQKAAGVSSAQAQAKMAKEDFDRYAALAKQGWVSTQ